MIRTAMSRGRALGSFSAAMDLFLAGAVVTTTGAAQSAEPAGDCTPPYAESDLRSALEAGDVPVTVKSVVEGTDPVVFEGKVFGIVNDLIAFDVDMIMVELTPLTDPDRIGGIWQGMSGSPVYADGKLIGAIAYGLSSGPSWVAGVTPFEDMDNYLAAPAGKVAVGPATARTIARSSDATMAEASGGFSALRMPIGVSGLSREPVDRLAQIRDSGTHAWLPKSTYAAGSASSAAAAGPETIVAGGNLAASLSYGDVTQAGVGTATSVCDGRVVGFGHPMTFLGRTTLTMHPASAVYVQEDSVGAPFKVANLGEPAGTITDDRRTGITGFFGTAPDTTDITSTVSYGTESRTGSSHVSVAKAVAATTFYELIGNHDRVLDAQTAGSELLSWTINGHQTDGPDFSLAVTDRYASDFDITFDAAFELADFVWALSAIPGVTIDDVTTDSDVVDDHATFSVTGLEQRRAGTWVRIAKGEPVLATAGKKLALRAVLTSATGTTTAPVAVMIPAGASGSLARVDVTGGGSVWSQASYPRSVAQAQRYVTRLVRNDQLQVELELLTRRGVTRKTTLSAAQDKVVLGHRAVRILVR